MYKNVNAFQILLRFIFEHYMHLFFALSIYIFSGCLDVSDNIVTTHDIKQTLNLYFPDSEHAVEFKSIFKCSYFCTTKGDFFTFLVRTKSFYLNNRHCKSDIHNNILIFCYYRFSSLFQTWLVKIVYIVTGIQHV